MAGHIVATIDQIPPGARKLVEVNGRAIVIYNLGGEFFALNNRCPHRGGSLCDGIQTGVVESSEPGRYRYSRMVKRPRHGWEFDIRTGRSWCDPARLRVRQYPVSVRPGIELVEAPYVVQSFPVRLEDNYIVVGA